MSINTVKVQTTGSSYSLPYGPSSDKLIYDCGQTLNVSVNIKKNFTIGDQVYKKSANGGYFEATYPVESSDNSFKLGFGAFLYVKPTNSSSYYLIGEDCNYTNSATNTNETTWNINLTDGDTLSFTFTIPDYAYNGQPLYLAISPGVVENPYTLITDYYFTSNPGRPKS